MSTTQWWLSLEAEDEGREVEGDAVAEVEAAHDVLTEKQVQEVKENEGKLKGLLWVGEKGNRRLGVGV